MKNNQTYQKILDFIHKDSNFKNNLFRSIFHSNVLYILLNIVEKIIKPKILFISIILSLIIYYSVLYISILNGFSARSEILIYLISALFIFLSLIRLVKIKSGSY